MRSRKFWELPVRPERLLVRTSGQSPHGGGTSPSPSPGSTQSMEQSTTTTARRVVRRGIATASLAVVASVAVAAAAFAHASFPAATAFGNKPNVRGGTGAPGSTPPYVAASTNVVYVRVPFEQTEPCGFRRHDGRRPGRRAGGWTAPKCGGAKAEVNNASTNFTDQPGGRVGLVMQARTSSVGHQ